ncbi:MAG: hypothetical protein M0Z56_12560 [Desulfobacteraceae bacterium]|nr:hypothetical protein [Desulfobacteraceae bacterium]
MFHFPDLFENCKDELTEAPSIYAQMDAAYSRIADAHGFHCSGCDENCCLTRFFHHTLVEYLYLIKGFYNLSTILQDQITVHAARVNEMVDQAVVAEKISRVMCPLNMDGLCVLYNYRPMICRLHGVPHQFRHPSGRMISGPGCAAFESQHGPAAGGMVLDRTPFYKDMVTLEGRVREKAGIREKLKMTVAQMIAAAGKNRKNRHETCRNRQPV